MFSGIALPQEVKQGACITSNFFTESGLGAPIQMLINLFPVVVLGLYIRNNWMSGGGGGDE
jgi:hypothetical protein